MLSVFCGSGREVAIFARAGFEVTGIDYHARRIAQARAYASQAGFQARFLVADFDQLEISERFDAIYLSPWMYGTYPGRDRRVALLRRMASFVEPDGVAVISFLTRTVTRGASLYYQIAKTISALSNGNRAVEIGDRLFSSYFVHYFDSGEAEKEAAEAGWKVVHAIDHGRGPGGAPLRFLILKSEAPPTTS